MASLFTEYASETRYGMDKFGYGRYDSHGLETNPQETPLKSALRLAWSNGCPIAGKLTGENSPYPLDWMIKRYAETNSWYGHAVFQARGNLAVSEWLSAPRFRLATEPVGHHEKLYVPKSHLWKISPMSGIEGYATPRVAIEIRNQVGKDEGNNVAYNLLAELARLSGNEPSRYLALLSQVAAQFKVPTEKILHHVYPVGILQEQNCKVTYLNLAKSLEQYAPTVWRSYMDMSKDQKAENDIAEIPQAV